MSRNDTAETWYWDTSDYATYLPSMQYDFDNVFSAWLFSFISRKCLLLFECFLAYAFLSIINGLLIRVAILCSSVVIFPLLSCANGILRTQLNRF